MSDANLEKARAQIQAQIDDLLGQLARLRDPDCTGAGTCHGCLGWCVECGDVDKTCDAGPHGCDWHYPRDEHGDRPKEPDSNRRWMAEKC